MSFIGLKTHFFLALNNIPLSIYTTVCLSINLLKDILVTSKLWSLQMKLLLTSIYRFLCGPKFSTPLGNTKEKDHIVRVCLFL